MFLIQGLMVGQKYEPLKIKSIIKNVILYILTL